MRRVLDFLVYIKIRLFVGFIRLMPRPAALFVCRAIASAVYWLDSKHRRIGLLNLGIAFPEASLDWRQGTLRKSFRQLGDLAVEISRLPSLSRSEVERRVVYEPGRGLENYLEARRAGTGVLFVTAHVSAWELLPAAHALWGHPLNFVVRPLDNPWLESWASRLRSRFGNRTIPKQNALRQALKTLSRGEDVGFLLDQNVLEKDGVFVPLFGQPACTSSAVARLALKTGSPIVAGFIYPRAQEGHYGIRFYPPVHPRRSDVPPWNVESLTAEINRLIEEIIRDFPWTWLWGHRRFSTQPDGRNPYDQSGDALQPGPK